MEPRGPASHTATAMDPVHGFQSGFGQNDITLTTQRGAVPRSSYGSEGTGEVSMGMGSTAFTGHQSQPEDAARQPFSMFDSGGGGGGLGPPGPLGPVNSLGCRTWGYPHGSRNGVGPGRPPRLHFTSGYFSPVRGPAFLSRESGHPRDSPAPLWGPGNFQGQGKRQPSSRHRPSTLVGLGRCPTGQRPP